MKCKEYDKEMLKIDINWLKGYGITENEAKDFIISLVRNRKWKNEE